MKKTKIAFIGAGSYGFTFKLVADIFSYAVLQDCELAFMDVDHERLNNVKILVQSYLEKHELKQQPLYTLDMDEALQGAHFIVNLVKIGFLEASRMDMDVPKKYGLYQTIGDTSGIGGVFRGLRSMIFCNHMLERIEALSADNAVVLNYSNPQAMLVMAASAVSAVPFIGLCHSVQGTTRVVANYLGVPYEEMDYEAGGINHMTWLTKLERHGENLYPRFKALVRERGIHWKPEEDDDIRANLGPTRLDMLLRTGFMVTESSEHFAEYVPYYLRTAETRKEFTIPIDKYLSNIAKKEKTYQGFVEQCKQGSVPELKRSVEYGPAIINAMLTNEPIKIYANVMNDGLIDNLPEWSSVEVAALVDRSGVQPCRYGTLPTQLAALCRMEIQVHQLAVEAVLHKNRESVYWALMMDPVTHSMLTLDQIEDVADTLIDGQQEYLGTCFPTQ